MSSSPHTDDHDVFESMRYKLYNAIHNYANFRVPTHRQTNFIRMYDPNKKLKYCSLQKSILDISNELKKLDAEIDTRSRERYRQNMQDGWWYGNVIYHDTKYCEKFNSEFRERVRAYWGYQCFECGSPQKVRRLSVHHIHYDKKMCCNGSPHDVVPLCASCHLKTNHNMDYWEDHFTELLYAYSPEGKCFFSKKEMLDWMRDPGEI